MARQPSEPALTRRRLLESGAVVSGSVLTATGAAGRTTDRRRQDDQQGNALACGSTVEGQLTSDDGTGFRSPEHYQDEYTFEAEAGTSVAIGMTADGPQPESDQSEGGADEETDGDGDQEEAAAPTPDPYLYLLAPDGTVLAEDDDSAGGLDAFIEGRSLPTDGTYTVIATSFDPGNDFAYQLTLDCGSPLEPDPIDCGTTVTDSLTPDDPTGFLSDGHAHDAYSFEGIAGEVVDVSMTGLEGPVDECEPVFPDPYLILLGPEGEYVAADDDSGGALDARLTTGLPADGEYTLVATSFAPENYFDYELTLDCRAPPELEPIGCGDTVQGELTADDEFGVRNEFGRHYHDSYVFQGSAGTDLTLTMQGRTPDDCPPQPGTIVGDPYLYLFGPDGTLLAEDDDAAGNLGAMIRHRLSEDGEYTVVATSFGAGELFPYELAVGCNDQPTPLPDPDTVACGESIAGELGPGDDAGFRSPEHFHDAYAFEGAAGDAVTLSMSASEGDCYLYLVGPEGAVVAEDDDGGGGLDALIRNYRLQSDGTYTVIATSFGPAEFFEYNLTVQCQ